MNNNIFLVGPMGAGKTTVGMALARRTGLNFIDSDKEIENHTGAKIALIFDIEGEEGFRKRESTIIDELTQSENLILATGGGAVLNEQNRLVLSERGTVIYLHAPIESLVKRTSRDRSRPLLNTGNPEKKLRDLMAIREPLYREIADLIVDTGKRTVPAIVKQITKKLNL